MNTIKIPSSAELQWLIREPSDRSVAVWRFMSLEKFLDMLASQSLYFPRVDCLDDPLDSCILPRENPGGSPDVQRWPAGVTADFVALQAALRRNSYVSCWHLAPHDRSESMAMWQVYAARGMGLAVVSDYDRVSRLVRVGEPNAVIGEVTYGDDGYPETLNDARVFVFRKQSCFRHEREVRVMLERSKVPNGGMPLGEYILHVNDPVLGVRVDVSPGDLIESVVMAPGASQWLVDAVTALVTRFGLARELVRRSSVITSIAASVGVPADETTRQFLDAALASPRRESVL